jgi:site-specific recombinase XerD
MGKVSEYLRHLRAARLSPATIAAYRSDLMLLRCWIRERGSSMEACTRVELEGWLMRDDVKAATTARRLSALRGYFRWAVESKLRQDDPTARLRAPKKRRRVPRPLTEAQVAALFEVAERGEGFVARRTLAFVRVAYSTGARISELLGLRLEDVDLESGLMRVLGKGEKERVIPIGPKAWAALREWLEVRREQLAQAGRLSSWVFIGKTGAQLRKSGMSRCLRATFDAAGMPDATAHSLRHSCATHMLEHKADVRVVQELLGHADLGTTQGYVAVSQRFLRAAHLESHPGA